MVYLVVWYDSNGKLNSQKFTRQDVAQIAAKYYEGCIFEQSVNEQVKIAYVAPAMQF